jgi:hypothetical protein
LGTGNVAENSFRIPFSRRLSRISHDFLKVTQLSCVALLPQIAGVLAGFLND